MEDTVNVNTFKIQLHLGLDKWISVKATWKQEDPTIKRQNCTEYLSAPKQNTL